MKTQTNFLNIKNFFKIFLFLGLATLFSNCRSDDGTPPAILYPQENPLAALMTNSGVNSIATYVNASHYELGMVFSPNVNGKMNSIEVKIPDTNSSLRVTIWDFTTQSVLRTETINVTAANTTVSKAITALNLDKNKKYLISMSSNDWYDRRITPTAPIPYPVAAGNITYHAYHWGSGTTQTYPTNTNSTNFTGDLSFTFQQTNAN